MPSAGNALRFGGDTLSRIPAVKVKPFLFYRQRGTDVLPLLYLRSYFITRIGKSQRFFALFSVFLPIFYNFLKIILKFPKNSLK
jgi:hypothetical protein